MKVLTTTISALALAATLSLAKDQQPGRPGPDAGGKHERPNPEEIFKKLDTNGDGSISLDEFKASPRGQENPARAEEIFKKIDKNGDGKLSLEEFKSHHPEGRERPNLEEIFKKLDTNNDGSISLDEFKAGPRAQEHPERAEEMFKKLDKNGDGKVTLEEFKAGHPEGRGQRGPEDRPGQGGNEGRRHKPGSTAGDVPR